MVSGALHPLLQQWLVGTRDAATCLSTGLLRMLGAFLSGQPDDGAPVAESEQGGWEEEAVRWARLLAVGLPPGDMQTRLVEVRRGTYTCLGRVGH